LQGAEVGGDRGHHGADLEAVVGEGAELEVEPGGIEADLPEGAERAVLGEGGLEPLEPFLGPAPEHLDVQVVHGAEVVVDELGADAGLLDDAPGGHRGVALGEQEPLTCRVR
jgi:hypothetical protein